VRLIALVRSIGWADINTDWLRPPALHRPDASFLDECCKHALAIMLIQGVTYFDEQLRAHTESVDLPGSPLRIRCTT